MTSRNNAELLSSLPLDTCRRLLVEKIDSAAVVRGSRPLVGRLKGTKLHVCRRIASKNSFQTYMRATLEAERGRTLIRCRFGMHPFVTVFLVVWFSMVVLIGGTILVATVQNSAADSAPVSGNTWVGIVIPILMVVFGLGLVSVGRAMSRGDREFFLAVLRDTLQAKPRG